MATTIDRGAGGRDEELSREAALERARERLRRLLPSDPELRQTTPSFDAIEEIIKCPTAIESVAKAFELYADRPCFAERAVEIASDGGERLLPRYEAVRYADVWARVQAFASGLKHEGLADTGAFVGICGFGSIDWVVADLACLYLAAVSAPFQTGMSPTDLKQVIQDTELSCIVCSAEQLESIESVLPQCPSVKSLVVIDLRQGDAAAEAKVAEHATETLRVSRMTAVEQRGRELGIVSKVLPCARGERDPLMTFFFTSGSTGTPKGAMIPANLLRDLWQIGFFFRLLNLVPEFPYDILNYMPLNHGAGRQAMTHAIVRGGLTSFVARSDMSTLFEDIRLARPTTLMLVPRVSGTIYQHFQGELVRRSEGVTDAQERARIADAIMAEMRESFLGDRLLLLLTSTAPTPPEVTTFLKQCFQIPVIDGYGATEAGPLTFDDRVIPDVRLEWKLVDVPELGYRTTDKPYPRGELHVKSRFVIPGYYKNPRATKELFDDEGFLNTGDIVEQRGPDTLVWIDRAKNVLKLAQGEFVATSRLEGIYASRSPFIRQVYVHGSGFRSYLLAVVVPNVEAVSAHLRDHGIEPDDAAIKKVVRSELDRIAREEKLRGHEVPRDFLVDREPFSVENGLLTASNKQSRPRLQARYRTDLDALYGAIERAQVEQLYSLRGAGAASVAERVKKAMGVTLGLTDLEVGQTDQSFIQLGGDSLNAVGLETLIDDITGVRVPVGFLLDRTSSVQAVVEYVENALSDKGRRNVTFAEVHGVGAKSIRAEDVKIEKFLGPDEIEAARAAKPASELPGQAEVALLTGANGFLGRFLTLELLERLSGERKKLYALVRAPNDAAASERLASAYRSDPALTKQFEELSAGGRLSVLAGDLMKPRFGLRDDIYARLEEEVDLIVHNGALVNHALGYEQLFEPNVLGTLAVMRLALARRVKSISYVSTVGVINAIERAEPIREEEDVRLLVTERPTEAGYAAGYGATKWVSELLLRDAHDKLGLPASIFRPSEIMAHSKFRGQVNVPDFFTRLVAGIVYTGLAPKSFYAPDAPEYAKHYDGLPVEMVARSIAAPSVSRRLGDEPLPRYATYHVVNPHHGDGVSLDVIVSWLKTAGYPVERIADYAQWYRTFHDRLTSLSEAQRQHSPLAILQAWALPQGARQRPEIMNTQLLERLRAIEPSLADLPHVSEALIHQMLDDMAVLGVIDRPLRMAG
jgi:fatty acid CoA ligase FadD9